jgi:hypothetical protein
VFDHCWSFEKASLSVRVWNEMLVSNIRRNNLSKKASSFRKCYSNFWKERGEKLMTCHLFLDNFLRFYDLWVVFKGLGVLKQNFSFKKNSNISIWYHEMFVFSESCLSQKTFYCRKLIVFSCLQFADCYIWSRILSCGVIFMLNHFYGIFFFEKFSFKKSWCCRKHVFVFEIVSLKDLNKFDQIIFFPVTF